LDGVSFKTITHGIETGILPVMSRLARDGHTTKMQSHYLPHTPESIGCFITGKNPGKTGLFGWYTYQNATRRLVSSEDLGFPFWDYLALPLVIIGLPLTYPAKPLNGALVASAHFSPSLTHFAFPENLAETAKEYGYVPPEIAISTTSDILRVTGRNLLAQEKLANYLIASTSWKLAIVYFQQTDIISHALGMVSSAASEESFQTFLIEVVLRQIDEWLGQVLQLLENDVDVILFSDHGQGLYDYSVNLSALLEQLGLATREGTSGLTSQSVFGTSRSTESKMPLFVSHNGDIRVGLLISEHMRNDLSFKTFAKAKLEEALYALKDPSGKPLVRHFKTSEQIYHGQRVHEGPDFLVEFDDKARESADFDTPCMKKRGFGHKVEGFMVASLHDTDTPTGIYPDVSYRTYDLAATVLALFGITTPDDFDGRPLAGVTKTHGRYVTPLRDRLKEVTEKRGLTREEEERILQRLRQLGYV